MIIDMKDIYVILGRKLKPHIFNTFVQKREYFNGYYL